MSARTQALVVADDPVYLNWLQNAIGSGVQLSLLRPLDADDLLARVQAAGSVDLLFIHFAPTNLESRVAWAERLLERWPELAVVGVGKAGEPDVVLAAMRAGARDFFTLQKDEAGVAAQISKLLRRSAAGGRSGAPRQGKLFAVLGSHPHEATAFLASHLALACAEIAGRGPRVLLADLAQPAGAASVMLNMAPAYGVLDAISDVYRCDATLVDTAFPKHASGLCVLSLPEDQMGLPAVNGDDLLKLTELLRGLFAVSVLAVDSTLPLPALTGLITQADQTLVLADQTVLRSRRCKHLLRALRLENCPMDRAGLVVDGYRRRVGLEPENLTELLDLPLRAILGGDPLLRTQSMNAGESLFSVAPKDAYARDVRRLAQQLLQGQAAPVETGWLDRLFA